MTPATTDSYRILVVDDEPRNTEILKVKLESEGYTVFEASDGEGALFAFEEHRPNMVLLDIMLPGLNGNEVCAALKARSGKNFVPILLITALTDDAARVEGFASGAEGYLAKPIHFVELLARIKNLRLLQTATISEAGPAPREAIYQVGRLPLDEVIKAIADRLGPARRTMYRVRSQERRGYIEVEDYKFIYARGDAASGREALDEMLRWPAAFFETMAIREIRSNMDVAFEDVLGEWLAKLDPWPLLHEKLAPRQTFLMANPAREAEIESQRQELQDMAGLFTDGRSVDQALRRGAGDVVHSLRLITELFYGGLLVRVGDAPQGFASTQPALRATAKEPPRLAPIVVPAQAPGSDFAAEVESLRIEVLSLTAAADHLRHENADLRNRLLQFIPSKSS